jgi:beta-N-acetylhexosaminidase
VLALAACAHLPVLPPGIDDVPLPDIGAVEIPAHPPTPSGPQRPALGSLTVREKVAQLVMPWIAGEYWANDNAALREALRLASEQGVGGFVLGIGASPYDFAAKLNTLQRASRLPLLVAADLESGPAMRIRGGTAFPGNMALGATGRELDAYEVGRVIALEAQAVGIHLVFAPVVDVNNNPANPIINTRSFGEDPRRVAVLGAAFIRGVAEHGLLTTAKHFPGHGDTGTDSHVAVPVIGADRARLDTLELVPFRAAIRAGVDAVMTAHVTVPALVGPDGPPATLSAAVLDTLLRGTLRFRGLVITDALNMGAIVARYGAAQAAVLAFRAGADILLMPANAAAAIDAVTAAVQSGEVSEARLDSSVTRVFAAKSHAGLWGRRTVDLSRVAGVVGTAEHAALALEIAQRSLVLARDSLGVVPLSAERRRHVLVVTYGDDTNRDAGTAFLAALRPGVDTLRTQRLWPASGPASYDSVRAAARLAWRPDAIAIPAALALLVEELSLAGRRVVLISTGSPYLLAQVPSVPTYLIAWSGSDGSERAAAQALLGQTTITGKLPVSLPPGYRVGDGIVR